jgi:hypothetical protein
MSLDPALDGAQGRTGQHGGNRRTDMPSSYVQPIQVRTIYFEHCHSGEPRQ